MQLSGSATIAQLKQANIVVTGASREWLMLRGFEENLKTMAQRRWRKINKGD